ncbi:hypothetical protein [uncultured Roseobacter sp.]|uniref:hypothetical protein n=1 Tax=uncultured Roseobacter sp. TaxID=114847 RepID=UPI002610F830|nr:hypothetical protein [uncultured Roseobacter sp.]
MKSQILLKASATTIALSFGSASHALTFDIFEPFTQTVSISTFENFPSRLGGTSARLTVPRREALGVNSQTVIYEAPEITVTPTDTKLSIDFRFADTVQTTGRLVTSARVPNEGDLIPAFDTDLLRVDGTYRRPPGSPPGCGGSTLAFCVQTFDLEPATTSPVPIVSRFGQAFDRQYGNTLTFRGLPVITDYSSAEGRSFSIGLEVIEATEVGTRDGTRVAADVALVVEADVTYTQRFTQARLETNLAQAARAAGYRQAAENAAALNNLLDFSLLVRRGAADDPALLSSVRDFVQEPAIREGLDRIDGDADRGGALELLANLVDQGIDAALLIAGKASPVERASFLADVSASYYQTLAFVTERLAEDPPRLDYQMKEQVNPEAVRSRLSTTEAFDREPFLTQAEKDSIADATIAFDYLFASLISYERYQGALIDGAWSLADEQYFLAIEQYDQGLNFLETFGPVDPLDDLIGEVNGVVNWLDVRNEFTGFLNDGSEAQIDDLAAVLGLGDITDTRGEGLFVFDFEVDRLFGTNLVETFRETDVAPVPLPASWGLLLGAVTLLASVQAKRRRAALS